MQLLLRCGCWCFVKTSAMRSLGKRDPAIESVPSHWKQRLMKKSPASVLLQSTVLFTQEVQAAETDRRMQKSSLPLRRGDEPTRAKNTLGRKEALYIRYRRSILGAPNLSPTHPRYATLISTVVQRCNVFLSLSVLRIVAGIMPRSRVSLASVPPCRRPALRIYRTDATANVCQAFVCCCW